MNNSEKIEDALNWIRIVLIAVLLAVIVLMEMIERRRRVVYMIEPGEATPTRVDTVYYYKLKNKNNANDIRDNKEKITEALPYATTRSRDRH